MVDELDLEQTCHRRCCVVVQYMCSVATDRDLEEKDQEKETQNGRETRKGTGSKKAVGRKGARAGKRKQQKEKKEEKRKQEKEARRLTYCFVFF